MDLVALEAVEHRAAGLLEALGPVDVRLLVEASSEFHKDDDVLAVVGCRREVLRHLRDVRQAVKRDLDRDDLGVGRRLLQQVEERLDAVVGVRQEDVVLADLVEHGAVAVDVAREDRRVRRVEQLALLVGREHLLQLEHV